MAEKTSIIKYFTEAVNQIPGLSQLFLLLGISLSIALGVSIVLWAQKPGMQVLYSDLSASDSANITEMLEGMNIAYELDAKNGEVLVPHNQLHEARIKLAGEGFQAAGSGGVGFELINKEEGLGVSQFIESRRYHHLLETEMSRTINSLQPVKSSRVHIAIPKNSVFMRDKRNTSASVVLHLYPGYQLTKNQNKAIVNLLASSIPELMPENITVVDHRGQLLSIEDEDDGMQISNTQLEYRRKIEDQYIKRVEKLLAPVLGLGNVRAEVSADINFSFAEESQESYNPNEQVVRSEQLDVETRQGKGGQGGVPGALANQPPEVAPATEADVAAEKTAFNASSTKRNYEVGRRISYINRPAGDLTRLSVAVLVANKVNTDAEGNTTTVAMSEEQLQRLTNLVKDAVGFNEQRGDRVTVMNADFIQPDIEEIVDDTSFWDQPWVRDAIKQILGAFLVLVLIFAIFRPLIKGLLQKPEPKPDPDAIEGIVQTPEEEVIPPMPFDEKLRLAQATVSDQPEKSAQVMKNWVAEGEPG
ncbi:MAG: flagellar M-ring protein FliF [Pseudomonadales bacterium]|nr:flagellar M-ring protein FliF [Pseudomonadales bacterium]